MKKVLLIIILFFLTSCFNNSVENQKLIKSNQVNEVVNINKSDKIISEMIPQKDLGILSNTGTDLILSGNTEVFKKEILNEKKENLESNLNKDIKKENKLNEITSSSDESIKKYVNDKIHYSKINYKPNDLVYIKGEYILDTKGNQTLRKEANENLQLLAKDFYDSFKVKLKVVSAFRSYEYQVGIKKGGCSDLFCAKAGYSEHQSGLAVDFFEATSQSEFLSKSDLKKYFEWLSQNSYKYGFHNSYKNGKNIDGYAIEPWHWRYLGVDFAKELQELNMTYGQYYAKYGEKK